MAAELRKAIAVVGGVASAAITAYAGRRNPSVVLVAMFVVWVALPFVGLFFGRFPVWLAVLMAVGAPAMYVKVALHHHRPMAFWFLMMPVICWGAMGICRVIGWWRGR